MSDGNPKGWSRLAAEFVVIFASVILALFADDWRDTRDRRGAEEEALELILRDLRTDSVTLETYRTRLQTSDSATARFLELLGERASDSALVAAYTAASSSWRYEPAYPTYRGLEQTGQLGLIADRALRDAIIDYHDEVLPYLEALQSNEASAETRLDDLESRHFQHVPGTAVERWSLTLVSGPGEITTDRMFVGALASLASTRRWLDFRIGQIILDENRKLARLILAHLSASNGQ